MWIRSVFLLAQNIRVSYTGQFFNCANEEDKKEPEGRSTLYPEQLTLMLCGLGWCRHYRMASKLCGMLVTEERVNCLHSWNHVTNKTRWYCCCSVTQSFPTLCHPMECSTPGFPVLHYVPEIAQTQVCRVGDAIQPSYPLLPPSSPALNPSQHQGLFQWACSSHHMAKVLELQHQ